MSRRTPPGFWVIWLAVAMDLLGFGIIIPLLPLYADSFGASPATIGALVASYSLAQFVFSPLWGRLSDRVGRRPVLLVTIAGSAVGSLILGLAGTITVLFVGRVVDGISGASIAVARAAVADVATPEDRPRLMGLLGAAFGVGFVVGPAIGGLAALGGASVPFFVAAGISVINLILAWIRIPETRQIGMATPGRRRAPMPPLVRRLVALAFVTVVAFGAFEATFALLGERRLDMSATEVGLVFAGVGVVLVGTQAVIAGVLGRRLGELRSIRLGITANVVGFAMMSMAASWPVLLVALGVLAFGQGLLTPMISSAIAGASERGASGLALGAHASATNLARVVGPLLGGAAFGITTSLPFQSAAVIVALSLLLVPRGTSLERAAEVGSQGL